MKGKTKLCVDCKHCPDGLKCVSPRLERSRVDGHAYWRYAYAMREGPGWLARLFSQCGRDALWFEPKEMT